MEENYVTRWLAQAEEGRWIMYDDHDDITDWDIILEIRLPANMAMMLDYTQHAYFQMQGYFEAQWEQMQRLMEEDHAEYSEQTEDWREAFDSIVQQNNLDDLGENE